MPSYKTHSVHAEYILDEMDKKIEIKKDDIKLYAIGPDTLISSDHEMFSYQHANKVKDYFLYLIDYIKDNRLYENSEVMAFLYGQIDHFILDIVTHPYISMVSELEPIVTKIGTHALIELWIDNYISKKYNKKDKFYYKKKIESENLKYLIDNMYFNIFGKKKEHEKYEKGLKMISFFDSYIRRELFLIPRICEMINLGDITYNENFEKILAYLNLENRIWTNPETGFIYDESFDELFLRAKTLSLETIKQINNNIYNNKTLDNYYINFDISYNTGMPCDNGVTKKYLKKMRDK